MATRRLLTLCLVLLLLVAHVASARASGEYLPSGVFKAWSAHKSPLPSEGWKMHVSPRPGEERVVAEKVLPVLRRMNVTHKIVATPQAWSRMSGTQAGKFITIYPTNEKQALAVARALDEVLQGHRGTGVKGQLPIGKTHMLSARYGGFNKYTVRNPHTGQEVHDVRGQAAPSWIKKTPFHAMGSHTDPNASLLVPKSRMGFFPRRGPK